MLIIGRIRFLALFVSGFFALVLTISFPSQSFCQESGLPDFSTSISFDMGSRTMKGRTIITFNDTREALIRMGTLKVSSVIDNGHPLETSTKDGAMTLKVKKGDVLDIEYECASGQGQPCVIGDDGISLTGNWCPSIDGLAYHKLEAVVPDGLTAVSSAEAIKRHRAPRGNLYSFEFPHPLQSMTFIAGRYVVKSDRFRGIEFGTYFFRGSEKLSRDCLVYAKKYLRLYEELIGKYPYKRFSIVESFLPAGYSAPTFVLLGRDETALPSAAKASLRHEIPLQWFGNLVYADHKKGNWTQGLTIYLSDHIDKGRRESGWDYRKQILIDYDSYAIPDEDFPLAEFTDVNGPASKAIGYGKSVMVFHMLGQLVGEKAFFSALRGFADKNGFREASWDDIRVAFEDRSGKNLGWFFKQWLNRKGAPSIDVSNVVIEPRGLQYAVSFDLLQGDDPYVFDISATVETDAGETTKIVRMNDKKGSFEIVTDASPKTLVLDREYDLFRKPDPEELPPVIAKLLSDDKGVLVRATGEETDGHGSPYNGMVDFFKEKGYSIKKPAEVTEEDVEGANLVLLGYDNPYVKRFFAGIKEPPPGFALITRKNPFSQSKVVGIVNASSDDETRTALKKITNYGNYSSIAFKKGVEVEKRIEGSERGWVMTLTEPVLGVEVARSLKLTEIINRVAGKKIIYVGEQHDRYEHHMTQFETIKALFKRNHEVAIGMEMFQRPFQKFLDDYIQGKIDERQFLKFSEYFKRWSFDYNLYKDILRFARSEKIPVIALNIKKEIVDKISKAGIDSLSAEEKKELPENMDMTDQDYRSRLEEVFKRHEGMGSRDFNHFFQAQIVWDETMAQSIDEYMKKNPGRQMVVLTGVGHTMFGSGIPKRTFRRNGLAYEIILNDQPVEPDIADYILFPKPLTMVTSPKLMTFLKEDNGKVSVEGFGEGSVAEEAGLKKGDIIVSVDGDKINGIDDLKIFLFYKKRGDTINVTVLRKKFLFGDKEISVKVTL